MLREGPWGWGDRRTGQEVMGRSDVESLNCGAEDKEGHTVLFCI